ncbi:MAG: PD40 domain-containing protein [Candidatus Omnitrophica bacterium]|nr:PD40 domain-containing protein [Candidatus Omnitrophota bacterium]
MKKWPAEWKIYDDESTGARVIQFTTHNSTNHPLYYLTNTFTPDSQGLIFVSDRDGRTNLYRGDLSTGEIVQLTDIPGLLPFSGNRVDHSVYFSTSHGEIARLDLDSLIVETLARIPEALLGEVTVNADRTKAVALCTRSGRPAFVVVDLLEKSHRFILDGAHALYHPQFHPTDPDLLVYSADPPDPRIWAVRADGSDDRCVYRNSPDEWFVHEMFLGKSDDLIVVQFHKSIERIGYFTGERKTIREMSAWHIASHPEGKWIVSDTHLPDIGLQLVNPETGEIHALCLTKATNRGFQWHKDHPVSAEGAAPGYATMVEEGREETTYGPQTSHPHPSFSPDGGWVAFTSDGTGNPQAYVVEVPEAFR